MPDGQPASTVEPASPSPVGPAVEIIDLHVAYDEVQAVAGLTMTAPSGAITAVVGRNGQGKTTSLEVCEGLRVADSGQVRVLGLDPQADAARLRPRVGVMLQDGGVPTAVKPRTVQSALAGLYANPRDPVELLDWLGLTAVNRQYRRLSGGEQQRVKLAAALIGRPELVFLDEPSTGLDPESRRGMWALIDALRRDGVAVVMTTHQMAEAEALADQIVVIDHGRAVAQGTLAALLGADSEVLTFRGPIGMDQDALLSAVETGVSISQTATGQYRITGAVTPQLIAAATTWCASYGGTPAELTVGRRSLEDVFFELTGATDGATT